MVCSHCKCAGHNKRTCPVSNELFPNVNRDITKPEYRAATALAALLPPPKNAKKSPKVLEGLEGCRNIWKVPSSYYTTAKGTTKCSLCGEKGHNSRKCSTKCMPCAPKQVSNASKLTDTEDVFGVLEQIKSVSFSGAPGTGFNGRKTEKMKFANGKKVDLDLGTETESVQVRRSRRIASKQ
jgi:hypothetical protein